MKISKRSTANRQTFTRFGTAILVLALMLAGCAAGGRPGYVAERKAAGEITIALERPQQIALLQDYELFVTLTNAAGQPIDGATVFLEQQMPAMPMNSNQPLGEPIGGGQYRIKGVFTMDGSWRLMIHATVAGNDHVAIFEQTVQPQS